MNAPTFSMWLIDRGKLSGCTLGWAHQEYMGRVAPGIPIPDIGALWTIQAEVFIKLRPIEPVFTMFHAFLGWLDPQSLKEWTAVVRILS